MSRRGVRDVVVCGGGVVGAACALALARLRLIAAHALNVLPVVRVWVSGGLRTVAFVVREMQRHVRSTVYVEEARRCRRDWVNNTRVLEINTSLR